MKINEIRIPDVDYEEKTDRVIANLRSYNSQVYTKLAQKVERISLLEAEIKQLKVEVKQSAREDVAEIFSIDDAVKTRVVETMSFILTLSKDPVATKSPKYKDILEALSEHFTPELTKMLENLKESMVTVVQKEPSLTVKSKTVSESRFTSWLHKFKNFVLNWGQGYDQRLAQLKQSASML